MILLWLLLVPAAGGVLAWIAGARHPDWPRWIALFVLAIDFILALTLIGPAVASGHTSWIASLDLPWIPQLGISFELGLDGLSLVLILLAIALGLLYSGVTMALATVRRTSSALSAANPGS